MRIADSNENLVGKVCVCSIGRPFIVTGTHTFEFGEARVGLGLDGKGTVASTHPIILAETGQEFHDKLLKRFNGKMSFNN